jgi:hypothetical protein
VPTLEEAEASFILPLRDAAARFACWNGRFAEAEGRWVALTVAMLMPALTHDPQAWEQGFSHFSASKAESLVNKLWLLCQGDHRQTPRGKEERRKVPTLLVARLKVFLFRSWAANVLSGAWSGLTWRQHRQHHGRR